VATKKDDLKSLCSDIALRHGQKAESLQVGLELLAIEILAHDPIMLNSIVTEDLNEKQLFNEWHTGGSSDGTIDGLLYNEELSNVFVIQTKYKSQKIDENTKEEARNFFSRVPEWADTTRRSNFNTDTQRLLDDSQFDPTQQQIDLYFITSQTSDDSDYENIADVQTNLYQEAGRNVICHFLVFSDLTSLIADSRSAKGNNTVREVTLNLPRDSYFIHRGDMDVLVATLKAQEIANVYRQRDIRNNLFNANVRAALATGRVNPKIRETAENDETSKYFYYYNNGITATCSSFTIDASKNQVTLSNLQVVNGAQTVAALAGALSRNPKSQAYVLLRVIETNDHYKNKSKVADSITKFQNTQNPVKASDFFSNEPFQEWISRKIDELSGKNNFPPVWYEHKRGVKVQSKAGRKKFTMEELAYLRYACLHDAPFTYKSQRDIWDGENNNKNFWMAFGSGGVEVVAWTSEEMAETAWMIRHWIKLRNRATQLNSEYRKAKINKSENIERTYLGVMARYMTALSFTLMCKLRERRIFDSFSQFEVSSKENDRIEELVFKVVRSAVKNSIENDWRHVANPRLNMPQDSDTWLELKKKVISDYDFESELV